MKQLTNVRPSRMAAAAVAAGALLAQPGCTTGLDEFRTVATPALHGGVSQIMNGFLDGFFAAIEPESSSGSSNTVITDQ